jgi:hypothetical protein
MDVEMDKACDMRGTDEKCIQNFIQEREETLSRVQHGWEDNIIGLTKQSARRWLDFLWLRNDPASNLCEHGNESLGYVRGGEFLD